MNKNTYDWLNKAIVLLGLITISIAIRIPPQPRSQIETNDAVKTIVTNELTKDGAVALNYELSKSTRPTNYKITLKPYLIKDAPKADADKYLTFDGTVEISLVAQYETDTIELNARNLTISTIKIEDKKRETDAKEMEVTHKVDEEVEKLIISSKTKLKKGSEYLLTITYTGFLNHPDLKGFYKSTYTNDEGVEIVIGTTQFESSGARRAFPCYDELGIKATFDVVIKAPKAYNTVISNSPIASSVDDKDDKDWKVTTFKTTKSAMSTYLVAFVVSDFESDKLKKKDAKDPEMNIYSQNKFIKLGQRSLQFGQLVLREINKFLNGDLSYADYMDKLDQVGIPDFAAGAMENWGLVTYRELQLLWDKETATSWNKQKIYLTIAHEFAHQWFGDLVTPTWWKYIWLNEGFATYVEYVAAEETILKLTDENKENSGWRLLEHFAIHERQNAFISDSLNTTRPMTSFAEAPEDVNNLFDTVIYAKAGSVLFMLEHILSKTVFQKGLNTYLQTSKLSTVTPEKLWDALQTEHEKYLLENPEAASNLGRLSVHDIGNSWSLQAGYPIVTVTKNGKTVQLEQKRFFTDSTHDTNTVFLIPINYLLQSELKDLKEVNTQPKHFLTSKSRHIEVEKEEDFILVNNLQTGYYRVNYDKENWEKIIEYTNKTENVKNLKPVTLSQLIDDTFTFSRIGLLPYNYTLKLAELLQSVDDYVPWYAAVNNLKTLDVQYSGSNSEKDYKAYQKTLLKSVYPKIKEAATEKTTHIEKLNRLLLLKRACDIDLDDCRNATSEALKTHIDSGKKIVPDDQAAIYCGGTRQADEEFYKLLTKRYKDIEKLYKDDVDKGEAEKKNLALGLGCMNDEKLLDTLLDELMEEEFPLKNHITEIFLGLIDGSQKGLEKVLDIYPKHYTHIKEVVGEDKAISIVQALGNKCSSDDHLKSLNNFDKNLDKDKVEENSRIRREIKRATDKVQQRIDWNNQYLDEINEWFETNKYQGDGCETVLMNLTLLGFGLIVTYLFNKQ
ncbi:aminopeptidase N-like [Chrysoperla carnea]|uniref:aminopeptidase N-like n=1 Tax=Chrysoperla carnea TaxID=189513 RepID=UPI001D074AC7|nr:aminopeptidase N-like [Chrysoperla carnea]